MPLVLTYSVMLLKMTGILIQVSKSSNPSSTCKPSVSDPTENNGATGEAARFAVGDVTLVHHYMLTLEAHKISMRTGKKIKIHKT